MNPVETSTCTCCGIVKPLTDFHKTKRNANGHQFKCKECVALYSKAYYYNRQKQRRERNIEILHDLGMTKCDICGYDKCFSAIEFHHVDVTQKNSHQDSMSYWLSLTENSFRKKIAIANLRVLCVRCHRELHAHS